MLVEQFIAQHRTPPHELIPDVDTSDVPLHADQELTQFYGYYDHYCYLPLYVFCGQALLACRLRSSRIDGAQHAAAVIKLLITHLRAIWPKTRFIVRGDSGFCRQRLIRWCERQGVGYVIGVGRSAAAGSPRGHRHQAAAHRRVIVELAGGIDLAVAEGDGAGEHRPHALQHARRDLAGAAVLDALDQGHDLAWLDLVDGAGTQRRQDRMSISSERQTWEACFLVQPGVWRLCHSLATARKVGVVESEACFSACLAAEGSSSLRASCHFLRASARPTLGYGPRLRVFSRPLTRYLPRQSLPPVGVTNRYRPSRS